MGKTYQYYAPTGSQIVGSFDTVQVRAEIDWFDENGEPEWKGHTEVFWDTQTTQTRDGKDLYLDEDGEVWALDQCTRKAEQD